jgi:hypothetical protein
MNVEQYLETLSQGGDLESLEAFDNTVENFVRLGHSMPSAKQMAVRAMKGNEKIGASKNTSAFGSGADKYGAAAQFDVKVTRNTGNINRVLPVALFGAIDFEGNYSAVLGTYLPSGVSVTVAKSAGNMVFTYTEGVANDTITVTCSQVAYNSFLSATITDVMTVRAIRYTLTDTTQLTNFDNIFAVVKRSLYGSDKRDNISVTSYREPNQFQSGIIDIGDVKNASSNVTSIDKETSLVIGMNDTLASGAFTATLSLFVNSYNKLNASSRL